VDADRVTSSRPMAPTSPDLELQPDLSMSLNSSADTDKSRNCPAVGSESSPASQLPAAGFPERPTSTTTSSSTSSRSGATLPGALPPAPTAEASGAPAPATMSTPRSTSPRPASSPDSGPSAPEDFAVHGRPLGERPLRPEEDIDRGSPQLVPSTSTSASVRALTSTIAPARSAPDYVPAEPPTREPADCAGSVSEDDRFGQISTSTRCSRLPRPRTWRTAVARTA